MSISPRLRLLPGSDGVCRVEYAVPEHRKLSASVQGETLSIEVGEQRTWRDGISFSFGPVEKPRITVYLPERDYAALSIDEDTGDVFLPGDFAFESIRFTLDTGDVDCVIDFSNPAALTPLLSFCRKKGAGVVLATTGYSEAQLQSERIVAEREGYSINIVRVDMTKPLPFDDGSFDMIFHPVSNCYVEEVEPIWRECYRVLQPGGVLLAGFDTGINYLFAGEDETSVVNSLPFNPLKNPEYMRQLEEFDGGVQFSHTLEEQIGGQLRAGFRLTDLFEDTNGEGRLHDLNIPSFIATRAVRM